MKQQDRAIASNLIKQALEQAKLSTMVGIYNRLAPGADSRTRTKLAPYTETGRLRSGEDDWWPEPTTNHQNLPNPKKVAKHEPLYNVRSCIIPDDGHVLLAADLSQAELYGYLAYAGDIQKLDMLASGSDLHRYTAAAIYGVKAEAISKDSTERMIGKFANFALGYGGGWKMFLEKVNKDADLTGIAIDAATAKRAVDVWRKLNPKTTQWWASVKQEVAQRGYLINAFGRKRVFLGAAASTGNDAIAYLPQSTIADHLNAALVRVYEKLDPAVLTLLLQVHDELLCQVPANRWYAAAKALKAEMAQPLLINDIEVNIPVEVSFSRVSWGEMQKCEL